MRLFHDKSDLVRFGLELTLDKSIFGVKYLAVCYGHAIVGVEWGEK